MEKRQKLLEVTELKTHFFTENGIIPSVDNVSFWVDQGETVALVGESGCGKSVTSLSIMGLVDFPGKVVNGSILFAQKNLLNLSKKEMRQIRGNEISMIFQEPLTSLNPVFTVGSQIQESILVHRRITKKAAKQQTIELLKKVGIPRPEQIYSDYPHMLSGGMRQRVMIAMAIACQPKLIIADEPTTALDVTIQAQILTIMRDLSREQGAAILLITHDLGVVAEMADRVIVMYAGQIVEQTDVYTLITKARHPYTQALLNSTPKLDQWDKPLESIEGSVPSPANMPVGCRFHPRCPHAVKTCIDHLPELTDLAPGHQVRCWLATETEGSAIGP